MTQLTRNFHSRGQSLPTKLNGAGLTSLIRAELIGKVDQATTIFNLDQYTIHPALTSSLFYENTILKIKIVWVFLTAVSSDEPLFTIMGVM